jgi:hypothetical protein
MAVATAMAIGGLAISAGSTAMSFMQASEQSRLQRQAQAKAAQAMAEARKRLEINYSKERSIQKEPYELQREAMLSTGAQAIQAGVESARGAAATAGRVQMAMNEGQGAIRTAMGQELTDIEKEIIDEESRLRDLNVQLDLGEVEGAQLAARDAQEAKVAAQTAGYKGIADTAQMGLNMLPLFFKDGEDSAGLGGVAPINPLPGNKLSYGPIGTNWAPMSSYKTQPSVGPQYPQPGSQYGMFGTNFSGVGY